MTFCAQYGNPLSFYGNIQLGVWLPIPIRGGYGAWPEEKPQEGMLISDWQEEKDALSIEVDTRIETIRLLKAELAVQEDISIRNHLRGLLASERAAKEKAFKLKAAAMRLAEEEELFIILH